MGQVVNVCDIVVLQVQMGQVTSEVQVLDLRDAVVVQVEDGQVLACGEVALRKSGTTKKFVVV